MGVEDKDKAKIRALEREVAALKEEMEELREQRRMQRFLLDLLPFRVAYVDRQLRYRFNNHQYASWLETGNAEELLGEEVSEIIGDDAMDEIQEHIQSALEGDEVTFSGVVNYRHGKRDVELRYVPHLVDNEVRGFGATIENKTAARMKDERLREAAIMFEASRDSIVVMNHRHKIVRVNKAFSELTGYCPDDALGKAPWNLTAPGRRDVLDTIWKAMVRDGHWQGELWHRHKDGSISPIWASVDTVADETGFIHHYVAVLTDLRAESTLSHLAHHDALTRLPNRLLLEARLEHTLERAHRAQEKAAILFLDLDGFKAVNDTYGHAEGDEVLQHIARRLEKLVRADLGSVVEAKAKAEAKGGVVGQAA